MNRRCRYPFVLFLLALSLVAASSAPAEPPPTFLLEWGTFGSLDGQFGKPSGVAVDSPGDVYVTDGNNNRMQKFDSEGNFITKWGSFCNTAASGVDACDGRFNYLIGVAVDSTDNVYVADYNNHRIQKFDSNGTFLTRWGSYCDTAASGVDACNGQFKYPVGVAIDALGNIFVADSHNHRIQKFDSTGTYLTKWGSDGTGDGELKNAVGVAVDTSGNVYVADSGNTRIQKFDNNGGYIGQWGTDGPGDGEFRDPVGVAVDAAGNVYVVGKANHRVQKFDSTGTFLTKWGSEGNDAGQFSYPWGLAVDDSGIVYVADRGNDRIQKFGPALNLFIAEPELPISLQRDVAPAPKRVLLLTR